MKTHIALNIPSASQRKNMSTATKDQSKDSKELKFKDMQIVRSGKQIILPEGMSYHEGRTWLTRQEEAEEKVVEIYATIDCYPLDGIVALARAMEKIYGFMFVAGTPGFFGSQPPTLVQIDTPNGQVTAPIGRLQPPKFEGGFIDTTPSGMSLVIGGQVKKKYESECKELIEATKECLKESSIYRGEAFTLDLDWMTNDEKFHPVKHAPKFMGDLSTVNENGVILNDDIKKELAAAIYGRIEQSEAYESMGIPLKHTALFAGSFGTGKTLTSRIIASKAVNNEWTFIYLKSIEQFATALRLAQMYAPAVLFAEDIDLVTSGDRDVNMNEILNTLDGVDTKDKSILTVLTTNKEDKIEKAMIRAGRIDTLIQFKYPDAKAAMQFVELYARDNDGKSLLSAMTEEERTITGESLAGKIPAFIAEAVHKAKCYAIAKHGKDIVGHVTCEAITAAARSQKAQIELLEGKTQMTLAEKTLAAVQHLGHVEVSMRQPLPDVSTKVEKSS